MATKEIALFGGSFNPIHNHHIRMTNLILEKRFADEVWLLPPKNHPFNKKLAPIENRINMINLAFSNPRVKVDRTDADADETNYTLNTIRKLKSQYPHEFSLVISSDILYEINQWHGRDKLLEETEFIIFNRNNYPFFKIPDMKLKATIQVRISNESSSEIRELVSQNKSLKNLIPSSIEEYIQKRGLYK